MAPLSTATATSTPNGNLSPLPWRVPVESDELTESHESWARSVEPPSLSVPSHDMSRVPSPPTEWAVTVNLLSKLALAPVPPPSWWKPEAAFRASIETWTHSFRGGSNHAPAGESTESTSVVFLLCLAGMGEVQSAATGPRRLGPGSGFVATDSSDVAFSLPQGSAGWTFIRVEIFHPYLRARLMNEIRGGALVEVCPNDTLTTSAVRLARGGIVKDFQDELEVEMALFEFAVAFQRWARRSTIGQREAERFMDEVRMQVLAKLPRAVEVRSLAKNFGMSRSYFSCLFRARTGMTPAHFATEIRIQKVERMLLDTHEPLKTIAVACGFANANHLCKVYRRFRNDTPTAFRRELRLLARPRSAAVAI